MKKIRTLLNYKDFFEKAIHDYQRYRNSYGVFELTDCLLTLNSLPEWIMNCPEAKHEMKDIASQKLSIMKGQNSFEFNEDLFDSIDQKLRFIRIFSNHSKHSVPKRKFPKIVMSTTLPATFPIRFENISIGEKFFKAETILSDVIDFWAETLKVQ